ncbi:PA2817 family protein [Cellvibrio fontiphilus]|uniref:PA2817 family protein n=1 Tax=Cellvibrio fontiphilus TaxID=1815559 RepID=A0ABV7FFQ9_9GAMM
MSISSIEENPYDKEYYFYHLELLQAFVTQIKELPPFSLENPDETNSEFLTALNKLTTHTQAADWLDQGQALLCRVVSNYPHLMPLLYRDLLWFFGGDCLHYMPDDEINLFQQLDEQREQAKQGQQAFSYAEARAKIMRMH